MARIFLTGFVAGLLLTALLAMQVWPALIPFVPRSGALPGALLVGLACGAAGAVFVTARHSRG